MQLCHVLNRGVDKRTLFEDDTDYLRFIHDLFEFNDQNPLPPMTRFLFQKNPRIEERILSAPHAPRKLLVDIHAFCLMPNHYHLFLSPRIERGVSIFMKRVNMGYALYFNQKYERVGTLFQSRYKSVPITEKSHFLHLPFYIHFNPLDLKYSEWRSRTLSSSDAALTFLKNYRWSSHMDYLGIKNFPSITSREFLNEVLGGPRGYEKSIREWLQDIEIPPKKFLFE
ncbi:MAG: transposase [Candidatus Liptonbacteria bacterium]|nr:transposase [Candidatus Liptonbacteria bacterium]